MRSIVRWDDGMIDPIITGWRRNSRKKKAKGCGAEPDLRALALPSSARSAENSPMMLLSGCWSYGLRSQMMLLKARATLTDGWIDQTYLIAVSCMMVGKATGTRAESARHRVVTLLACFGRVNEILRRTI
jgi:hypothetical protein